VIVKPFKNKKMSFNYRLDSIQKNALKISFKHLHNNDQVFLFGSRTNLEKHGGDIDLLIYSQQPSFSLSRQITRDFFKNCEEKIDLIIINPLEITHEQHLFINSIEKIPLIL